MAKSRTFCIYLLKEGFNAGNALKTDHSLGDPADASQLPEGATLYVLDKSPSQPWWKAYWGVSQNLRQVLKGAIVFLPIGERCFAITFGHTYHFLKDESYEYDFGLITTLNALDPEKIKSTDIFQPENAKRERIQSPTASNLTFFDINNDESIIKKLTGAVKTEYQGILSNITGANNLRITSKVTAREISDLCSRVLEIYNKEDYKESFPDIQNISPVKDPTLIETLNGKLLNAFTDNSIDLVLTVPDILDHQEPSYTIYSGEGRTNLKFDDIYIANYREYLQEKEVTEVDVKKLKAHKLNLKDENDNTIKSYPIYKCLLFDCEIDNGDEDNEHYHMCEGEWYRVETDYIKQLKTSLDPVFADYGLLSDCDQKREDDYNEKVANDNSSSVVCLDKTNIAPKGNIEPCDLYTVENDRAILIHIKISTRSSSLSHLFNQGANSIKLLRMDGTSRDKLKALLPDVNFKAPIDNNKFKVIFGIITAKDKVKKSDNLPIFSRISLQRIMNELKLMGIEGEVVLIKDLVDRKKQKEK